MGQPSSENRPDWPFIQNGAVTLFRKQSILDAATLVLSGDGYRVHQIDCGTETSMMRDLSIALFWDEKFGYQPDHLNLNALNDALRYEPRLDLRFCWFSTDLPDF